MTQESAFKPYQKFSIEMQVPELGHRSSEEVPRIASPSSSTIGATPIESPQVKPFDYTVEKILKSSPPSVSSTVPTHAMDPTQGQEIFPPSLYDLAKWSNIPLGLIARHLWWQNQKSVPDMSDIASREVTSSDFHSSSMCESC